ncbi:membrane integrity-associated transporter subunit PqiC [Geobacter sulfurreducens]|uniref:PqiC family protein n=1 Tax=Geobacter sulfurreducens TaxID=35554 RepID=UPI0001D8F427|nr:PqiC family protein [Geobacter sulfurreducens]ADI85445.1 protein of unknown function DUF330 [Geobacter sulfurreducens KN400]QVW34513.1 membrane integrity-associated transporter subunit PqiC [Geobacter sulfurreducens]
MRLRSAGYVALFFYAAIHCAACGGTPPARFYTLSSLAGSGSEEGRPSAGQQRKVLGIGPVALAGYLYHPGITTRSGPNTVSRAELDRWGSPLGDEVTRVLVENMGELLPHGRYVVLPWLEASALDCRVQLTITRFDGPLEGPVVLNASWILFGGGANTVRASGEVSITEPLRGSGYGATADAMSRALAGLSRRIATEIGTVADAAGT